MLLNGRSRTDEDQAPNGSPEGEETARLEHEMRREIDRALQGLEFGEVTITVRDRRIVQIERIVRIRHLKPKKS